MPTNAPNVHHAQMAAVVLRDTTTHTMTLHLHEKQHKITHLVVVPHDCLAALGLHGGTRATLAILLVLERIPG